MVVSSPQCDENTAFFSGFPLGGIHGQGILPVIPLELQGKKHQPFSITQPQKITKMQPSPPQYPQSWSLSAKRVKSLYFHYLAAIKQGSVIVCGCFISTVRWKYSLFPVFPLAGSTAKAFCWLFLWKFKEKSISHFLWYKRLCHRK